MKTHLNIHGYDGIRNWYNNHLRAHLSPEEQKHSRAPMQRLNKLWEKEAHPHYQRFHALQERWDTLLDTNAKLIFMFRLRQEVETLVVPLGVTLKHIAVVPEAHLRLSPVTLDDTILAALVPNEKMKKITKEEEEDSEEKDPLEVWASFVQLDKIHKLKKTGTFARHLTTDGVSVNLTFVKAVKLTEERKGELAVKQRRVQAKLQRVANKAAGLNIKVPRVKAYERDKCRLPLPHGEYAEETITGIPEAMLNYVGVDPGRRTMLSAVALHDPTHTLQTDQRELKRETGSTARQNATQRYIDQLGFKRVFTSFYREALTKKTVGLASLQAYRQILGCYWVKLWRCFGAKRYCQIRFQYHRRRESYMERLTSKVVDHFTIVAADQTPVKPILLFGAGGTTGGFGHVRGMSGVKGPLVETRKRLARKCTLVVCSEFRTSMCCGECGRKLQHPRHPLTGQIDQSQSFCRQPNHSAMVDRDLDAARKIGCRFIRQQRGEGLGPWQDYTIRILDDPDPSPKSVVPQLSPHRLFL
jgi:hypothetical protein